MRKKIIYVARALAVLFVIFLSLFALDVFGSPNWFGGLLIHLIPSFILVVLAAVSWRRPRLGGILFLAAGVVMAFFFHSAVIAAPALLVGILFLAAEKIGPKRA